MEIGELAVFSCGFDIVVQVIAISTNFKIVVEYYFVDELFFLVFADLIGVCFVVFVLRYGSLVYADDVFCHFDLLVEYVYVSRGGHVFVKIIVVQIQVKYLRLGILINSHSICLMVVLEMVRVYWTNNFKLCWFNCWAFQCTLFDI